MGPGIVVEEGRLMGGSESALWWGTCRVGVCLGWIEGSDKCM